MNTICLSLGHNSSAVYIGEEVVGYEQERLSKKKSDSAFPALAIDAIACDIGQDAFDSIDRVYISHWFDNFDPCTTVNKYYDANVVKHLFPSAILEHTHQDGISHHDAHAYSALAFYEDAIGYKNDADKKSLGVIVIDGFGNNQEVASLYVQNGRSDTKSILPDSNLDLVHRVYGYEFSLGLLYQYAATAAGMDGINDVYKFLGYRTHVKRHDIAMLDRVATDIIAQYTPAYRDQGMTEHTSADSSLIDYAKLAVVKQQVEQLFSRLKSSDVFTTRARIGYVVQAVLESIVLDYAARLDVDILLAAGGCFYNVRLNSKLRNRHRGEHICFMPLAGDQGAALGMPYARTRERIDFSNLCWGRREIYDLPKLPGLYQLSEEPDAVELITKSLNDGLIVNVVRSTMEFGPRALCKTSSLALCKPELVEAINSANGRDTVMPMAPVMLEKNALNCFSHYDLSRTLASDAFMITAHDYKQHDDSLLGAMHKDLDGSFSGRPQIVSAEHDALMVDVLERLDVAGHKALINTSLNTHGTPIIHCMDDVVKLHKTWLETCPASFITIVLED